jgi:hypothetical protein
MAVGSQSVPENSYIDMTLRERPTVRLVAATAVMREGEYIDLALARPTVRLATPPGDRVPGGHRALERPTVRLALNGAGQGEVNGALADPDRTTLPALLVSYVYLDKVRKLLPRWAYRDWVLDSGAFTAFNSGQPIVLQDYIDECRRLRDEGDGKLTEVFSLDVIGDWRASLRNLEEMWRQGIEAVPCFHQGEPEDVLRGLARDYPKIALGGVVGMAEKPKLDWCRRCFDRVWPKRIHGFGMSGQRLVMALPFDSVDATNWQIGPTKFGRWRTLGDASWRGSKQNLRSEVQWYLDLERRARERWRATWASVEGQV